MVARLFTDTLYSTLTTLPSSSAHASSSHCFILALQLEQALAPLSLVDAYSRLHGEFAQHPFFARSLAAILLQALLSHCQIGTTAIVSLDQVVAWLLAADGSTLAAVAAMELGRLTTETAEQLQVWQSIVNRYVKMGAVIMSQKIEIILLQYLNV